ncbi:MAG: hypothetical protein COC24_013285 [Alphaproteobacteria bacterium]|nr:hypothetical protein [Alphaproteobacteria bacterium]
MTQTNLLRSEDIFDCGQRLPLEALSSSLPAILFVDIEGQVGGCARPSYEALRSENKSLRLRLKIAEDLAEMYCQGWLNAADDAEGLEEKLHSVEVALTADLVGEVN